MPMPQYLGHGPRKRRRSSCSEVSGPWSSKSRPNFPPVKYWEDLSNHPHSKVHLTKQALRAFDNIGSACSSLPVPKKPRRSKLLATLPSGGSTDGLRTQELLQCDKSTNLRKLRRFASHGGPDIRDLRGFTLNEPSYGMSSQQSSRKRPSRSTTTAKRTKLSPYDNNFLQHLINYRIYPPRYTFPAGGGLPRPDNIDEIKQALANPRRSLSPSQFSDERFGSFQDAEQHAAKESQLMTTVIPLIVGNLDDHKCAAGQVQFNNLDHLTNGSLVRGNPDVYYGARPEQLHQELREQLSGQIEPSTQDNLPLAPNFFLHVKGPDGAPAVGSRQACYDGALGARGIHSLQTYGQPEPQYDNKAYTLTSVYQDGHLKIYATHPIPPPHPEKKAGFAMTQVDTFSLIKNADVFRRGVAAYRNGRDWAKQQRDRVINQANERHAEAKASASAASPVGDIPELGCTRAPSSAESGAANTGSHSPVPSSHESETSVDGLCCDELRRRPVKRAKVHSPRTRHVDST